MCKCSNCESEKYAIIKDLNLVANTDIYTNDWIYEFDIQLVICLECNNIYAIKKN